MDQQRKYNRYYYKAPSQIVFDNGFLGMTTKAQRKNRFNGTFWLNSKPRPQMTKLL